MQDGMAKTVVVFHLAQVLRKSGLTNAERDAIRAAIATTTWLIARRAKYRDGIKARKAAQAQEDAE